MKELNKFTNLRQKNDFWLKRHEKSNIHWQTTKPESAPWKLETIQPARSTLGRSNDGNVFRLKSRTSWPFKVSSTTSTTRSICCTPIKLMPSSSFRSLLPWGTHPATTKGFFAVLHFSIRVVIADWLGDFTVHLQQF